MNKPYTIPDPQPVPRQRWRWLAVTVGVVLLAGTGIAIYAWQAGDGRKRDRALRDCREGRLAQAEPVLTDLLARHPDDTEVRSELARALTFDDRPNDALPHLSRLLEAEPTNVAFLKLRMEQHQKLKNKEEEYSDARRLVELGGGDDKLRRSAVGQAFALGRFPEAEDLCRAGLLESPKHRELRLLLANILRARGDDDGAAVVLDELIRDDPKNFNALFLRGVLHDETGHSDLAVPLLWQVFTGDPTRKRTCGYQLSLALSKVGREEEAQKVLDEVRRLQDLDIYSEAMKSQPDNLDLQVRLARSLLEDGHTADGVRLLELVLRRDPRYAPAHLALAAHYEKAGRADLADRHRKLAGR